MQIISSRANFGNLVFTMMISLVISCVLVEGVLRDKLLNVGNDSNVAKREITFVFLSTRRKEK